MPNPAAANAAPIAPPVTAPGAQALRVVPLADLLAHPFPPRAHLLHPWLRQDESALLWAPTGLGKTMLVLTMALAVAGGGAVFGWKAETPRRVLLVDAEMHAEDLRDRLAMLAGTIEGFDAEAAGGNLHVLSRQHQGGAVRFPDLAETTPPDPARKAGQDAMRVAERKSLTERPGSPAVAVRNGSAA